MNKLLTMTTAAGLLMAIAVLAADPNEKTVFVTSASYNGNLGGLAGADAKRKRKARHQSCLLALTWPGCPMEPTAPTHASPNLPILTYCPMERRLLKIISI